MTFSVRSNYSRYDLAGSTASPATAAPKKLPIVANPAKFSQITLKTSRNGTATRAPELPHYRAQSTTVRNTATMMSSILLPIRKGVTNWASSEVRTWYNTGATNAYDRLSKKMME